MSTMEEENYSINLPGEWEKISGPDPYVYFNKNDKEALTVTFFTRSSDVSNNDRLEEFQRLVEARQQAEVETSDTTITLSDVSFAEQGTTYVATYTGTNNEDFLSATMLIGFEEFIAVFFYEGYGVDEVSFGMNTRLIMNSISFY